MPAFIHLAILAQARHRTPQRPGAGGTSSKDVSGIVLINDIESKSALLATPTLPTAPSDPAATPSATTFTVTTGGDAFSWAVDRVVGAYKWCARSPVATNYIILGVVSLVARLYRIGTPDGVVFDEYHFGRFVNNYLDGDYFFDIHPPLGKLTLAFLGYLTYVSRVPPGAVCKLVARGGMCGWGAEGGAWGFGAWWVGNALQHTGFHCGYDTPWRAFLFFVLLAGPALGHGPPVAPRPHPGPSHCLRHCASWGGRVRALTGEQGRAPGRCRGCRACRQSNPHVSIQVSSRSLLSPPPLPTPPPAPTPPPPPLCPQLSPPTQPLAAPSCVHHQPPTVLGRGCVCGCPVTPSRHHPSQRTRTPPNSGYDSKVCSYANIGDNFAPDCKYVNLRIIAALFGTAFPLLIHGIVLALGASTHAAFFAGAITIFDMLGVTESRLILTDSQLMFYLGASLLVGLQFWRRLEALGDAGSRMSRRETNLWMVGLGLVCGAAVSIKWTALVTPFMIGVESAFGVFGLVKRRVPLGTLAKAAAVAGLQYATWFWFHFAMLPKTGDGDAFMPVGFQATLVGNEHYKVRACVCACL